MVQGLGILNTNPYPITLGYDTAGIVEEVGSDVTHLAKGDRVCVLDEPSTAKIPQQPLQILSVSRR